MCLLCQQCNHLEPKQNQANNMWGQSALEIIDMPCQLFNKNFTKAWHMTELASAKVIRLFDGIRFVLLAEKKGGGETENIQFSSLN